MGKLIERPGGGGTVIDSRSKHEFSAKKGLGRVGRSTFLLGADQRLSGEGVFNGIYYCLWDSGPVHLHTLVHETCYFNVLASRFDFEYCE